VNWLYENYLYALYAVPVIALISFIIRRKNLAVLKKLKINYFGLQIKVFLTDLFFILFLIFLILSAAGPRKGFKPVTDERTGLNIAFAVDVSRSMLAEDLKPNRLKKSVSALQQMYKSLPGAGFSLIPFKGDAEIVVPMTQDYHILDLWSAKLSPGIFSGGGTNIEKALETAEDSFPDTDGRIKIIVLITDGESLEGNINRICRKLSAGAVPVYVLAAGTGRGAVIPLGNGKYVTGENGEKIISRADLESLENIAENTGGEFRRLDELGAVSETIKSIAELENLAEKRGIHFEISDIYRNFLLPALAALCLFFLSRIVQWRKS